MKLEKKDCLEILENALAYIVVFAMFAYGIGKIVQFNGAVPNNKMVSELTAQQLMWAFYGYSKTFVYVLGILEVVGGLLMFFRRTRLLACFLVSTILINVILQDIIIVWFHKNKMVQVFKILTNVETTSTKRKMFFFKISLGVLLFVVLRILEYYVTIKW
jgi:uncharacterized membrane protein